MRNVDRIKELEYELGRYKKAVKTRDTIIEELKLDITGQYEVAQIIAAYMSVLLEGRKQVRVSRDEIAARLGKYKITMEQDGDNYILGVKEIEGAE